ncbi:MAG: hypothetical protein M3253_06335 [Chloroflexota bacterium]|nr:hypothetical protein [Chloroflexota bacterium]
MDLNVEPTYRRRRRNPLTTLLSVLLAIGCSATLLPGASPNSVYAGMPEPDAFAAPTAPNVDAQLANDTTYTLNPSIVRLRAGSHTLRRFDTASGRQLRERTVRFSTAVRFRTADQLSRFGDYSYAKLTSGNYSGWWVRARGVAPSALTAFSDARQVRLARGIHTGIRFYSNMRVSVRRSATLDNAATYEVSRRATFGTKTYFFLTTGPLANRWVARSSAVTLVTQSSSNSSTGTTTPTQPPATWKAILLIYRDTDVTFTRPDGSTYRLRARMSDSMYDLSRSVVNKFVNSASTWSDSYAAMSLTVVDVPVPLTRLDPLGSGYWVGPKAVRPEMDKYAPAGKYDSIFVLWQNKDSAGVSVPVGGWGLTVAPGSWANGAGYSSIFAPKEAWWWTGVQQPQEVFVHEWMHQVLFFHENAGRLKLDLHATGQYGYSAVDGTYKAWLSDVMRGRVKDGSTLLGVNYKTWRAGVPTNTAGW